MPETPSLRSTCSDDRRLFVPGTTRTLGLDPAMATTGYAVFAGATLIAAGKITTPPHDAEPLRLWSLFEELLGLVHEYQVDHFAVETFSAFYRSHRDHPADPSVLAAATGSQRRGRHDRADVNPRSMFLLKAAQTAVQMAAMVAGCPLFLYQVAEWKGSQRVSKEAIRDRAHLLYKVPTQDHNITDAVMIAHHHINAGRLNPDRAVWIRGASLTTPLSAFISDDLANIAPGEPSVPFASAGPSSGSLEPGSPSVSTPAASGKQTAGTRKRRRPANT